MRMDRRPWTRQSSRRDLANKCSEESGAQVRALTFGTLQNFVYRLGSERNSPTKAAPVGLVQISRRSGAQRDRSRSSRISHIHHRSRRRHTWATREEPIPYNDMRASQTIVFMGSNSREAHPFQLSTSWTVRNQPRPNVVRSLPALYKTRTAAHANRYVLCPLRQPYIA